MVDLTLKCNLCPLCFPNEISAFSHFFRFPRVILPKINKVPGYKSRLLIQKGCIVFLCLEMSLFFIVNDFIRYLRKNRKGLKFNEITLIIIFNSYGQNNI